MTLSLFKIEPCDLNQKTMCNIYTSPVSTAKVNQFHNFQTIVIINKTILSQRQPYTSLN